jgi:hypothetical protein
MNRTRTAVGCLAIFATISFASGVAFAQFRFDAWSVDQFPQPGGGFTYRLFAVEVGSVFFGVPSGGTSLTAPDGTVFSTTSRQMDFPSFSALGATLFGDWIVVEHPTSGADRTYTVRIAPFSLSSVFSVTPIITSPTPGSTIPEDFIVKWDPQGQTSSRGISYDAGTGLSVEQPQFGVDGTFSAGFHTHLLQDPPAPFTVTTYVQSFLPNPSVVSRSSSLNGQSITTSFAFDAHSLAATYQVVPEPCAMTLSAIATLFIGCSRVTPLKRRRSRA